MSRASPSDMLGILDEPLAFIDPSKTRPPKALDEIMEANRSRRSDRSGRPSPMPPAPMADTTSYGPNTGARYQGHRVFGADYRLNVSLPTERDTAPRPPAGMPLAP